MAQQGRRRGHLALVAAAAQMCVAPFKCYLASVLDGHPAEERGLAMAGVSGRVGLGRGFAAQSALSCWAGCVQDSDKDKLRSSLGQAIMVERPDVKVRGEPVASIGLGRRARCQHG